jgi:hypothetical protein
MRRNTSLANDTYDFVDHRDENTDKISLIKSNFQKEKTSELRILVNEEIENQL